MKKMLKIVAVAALVVVIVALVGFAVLKVLASQPAAPDNYQQTVQAGGPIEQTYLANGSHEVLEHEDAVPQGFKKFTTYYPAELETGTGTYPVVVLCNGSGTPLSKYPAVARHLASWGFIVIGTEEDYSWNGFGAEMCLRYLERCNENQEIDGKPSLFYQKVDFDRVGIVGHSQGGVGVLNAVTDTDHKGVYKAAVALSPTNKELAHNLMWDYDATLVDVPILLVSGAGGGDDWVVTGEQLESIYVDIPSQKFMARRVATGHGPMLYSAQGYVVAWFMWLLQDDEQAAQAFVGKNPELMENPRYQDQRAG